MNFSTTTWTGVAGAITSLLTAISTLSTQMESLNPFLSQDTRVKIAIASAVATAALRIWQGQATPDKKPEA